MLLIPCPHCGSRDESEFVCGGEADRTRPVAPQALDDRAWSNYLYNSTNHKGWVREWWWHLYGCETWFSLERNTVSHEIRPCNDEAVS